MRTKIIGLAASFREQSLNKQFLSMAIAFAKQTGCDVAEIDYAACEAPIYREEAGKLPPGPKLLADALLQSHGMILATPEYNWSIPGGLKNIIDWLSTDERAPLKGKTGLLMCASPSPRGGVVGMQQLRVPLEHLGMWVYPHTISLANADEQMLQDATKQSEKDRMYLRTTIHDFMHKTKAMTHA